MSRDNKNIGIDFHGADLEDDYRDQVFDLVYENSTVTEGEIDDVLGNIGVWKLQLKIREINNVVNNGDPYRDQVRTIKNILNR